jgi:hypothetical protein
VRWVGLLLILAACGFQHGELGTGDAHVYMDAPIDIALDAQTATGPCPPYGPTPNEIVVQDTASLRAAVSTAPQGSVIALQDGTYNLVTTALVITTPGLTLRSHSHNAAAVIITGAGSPLIRINASNVTLTELTLSHAAVVAVLVEPLGGGDIMGDQIYDVTFDDDVGPAVRIYPFTLASAGAPYADYGTIACSRFKDTTAVDHCSRPMQLSIDAVATRGWTIRDNTFDHVACPTKLVRAIWIRGGSRDMAITNNQLLDSNGNITLGADPAANPARSYSDYVQPTECSALGAHLPQDWTSVACNNRIAGLGAPMFSPNGYFDDGLALWGACDTWALHNTVVSPAGAATAQNIEYRFAGTYVHLVNNLVEAVPAALNGGTQDPAFASSNVPYQATSDFVDATNGDLHLSATAMEAAGASIAGLAKCQVDADGKMRPVATPLVGAYER